MGAARDGMIERFNRTHQLALREYNSNAFHIHYSAPNSLVMDVVRAGQSDVSAAAIRQKIADGFTKASEIGFYEGQPTITDGHHNLVKNAITDPNGSTDFRVSSRRDGVHVAQSRYPLMRDIDIITRCAMEGECYTPEVLNKAGNYRNVRSCPKFRKPTS